MLETKKYIVHTIKFDNYFWTIVPEKMQCEKNGAADEGFIIVCSNKILSAIWIPKTNNAPQNNLAKN